MKKLLSLILCLSLFLCAAQAELQVPQPRPTQQELQSEFVKGLLSFLPNLNLGEKALRLEAAQEGQPPIDALLQQADGVYDLSGTASGIPLRAQVTQDALLVSYDGKVYRQPFDSMVKVSVSDGAGTGISINPMTLYPMLKNFYKSVILSSVKVDATKDAKHIAVDLTAEKLAEGLATLGDSLLEDPQIHNALESLGLDSLTESWPMLRTMIRNGMIQLSLKGDINADKDGMKADFNGLFLGTPLTLNAAVQDGMADFNFTVKDTLTLTGALNLRNGAYECHYSGPGKVEYNVVSEATGDGWHYVQTSNVGGKPQYSAEATLTQSAFDAALTCEMDDEKLTGDAHLDLTTGALNANLALPESLGDIALRLNGESTGTGYHAVLDVSQQGVALATADAVCTETEELRGLELSVVSAGDQPVSLLDLTCAYAKKTGAYELHYHDIGENTCDGDGVMTKPLQTANLTISQDGIFTQQITYEQRNDRRNYSTRLTVHEVSDDGAAELLNDTAFEMDKRTGVFTGSYEDANSIRADFRGVCAQDHLSLHVDETDYGFLTGYCDINARWDNGLLTGDFSYTDGYDVTTGNLMCSRALKTVSVTNGEQRYYVALEQGLFGLPKSLRLHLTDENRETTEVVLDSRRIYLQQEDTYTSIGWRFIDARTLRIDIAAAQGLLSDEVYTVDLTAGSDALGVKICNEDGETLFSGTLTPAEKTGFERLDASPNIEELTQEVVETIFTDILTAESEPAIED